MATKLDKTIKREIELDGKAYMVAISPDGIKLTQKGFPKGQEVSWRQLLGSAGEEGSEGGAGSAGGGGATGGGSTGGSGGGSGGGGQDSAIRPDTGEPNPELSL